MNTNEIRKIIGDGNFSVAEKRQAWIEYGGLLAQCPYKQGAQIGRWVREQGLDFVVDGRERSSAVKLRLVTFGIPESQLDDCPYSRPTDVLKWLRNQAKQDADPDAEQPSKPVKDEYGIDLIALGNTARSFIKAGDVGNLDAGSSETVVPIHGCSMATDWIPASKTWGDHGQKQMVGIRFKLVAEVQVFDVEHGEGGFEISQSNRPADFALFEDVRNFDGLMPETRQAAASLLHKINETEGVQYENAN